MSPSAEHKPLVRLEHITKIFNRGSVNESVLFDDFSFTIYERQFVSVVGSNGSGKTTALNLICGSLPVDAGRIFLRERDITKIPEHLRVRSIGRVFQDPTRGACPTLTILENMSLADNKGKPYGLAPGVNRKRQDEYRSRLELLGLGLEDKLNLPVEVLSGGQRQALALLIATMTPIDLLVLDEHTAALDPKSSETVMELTDRVVREKGVTAVMVTHNLRFAAEYGDRLVMMDKGRSVIDTGFEDKGRYKTADLLQVFNEISVECGN